MARKTVLSCSEFLSHMPDNGVPCTLEEHSIAVANNAKDLCKSNDEATRCAAYCAGLLHDVGKLSPSYQELFCKKLNQPDIDASDLHSAELALAHKYGRRQHAIFSCMLAWCLLYATNPHRGTNDHIARAILCHHGRLREGLGLGTHNAKFEESQKATAKNWSRFQAHARTRPEYPAWFDWTKASESFATRRNIGSHGNLKPATAEYLRGRLVFSALVQGDYLSFSSNKKMDSRRRFGAWMRIDAKRAHSRNLGVPSPINALRDEFQNNAISKYETDKCLDRHITIIEAPTGIGKTALLLEIMSRHANKGSLERCYYFSPLLALNNSFVELVRDKNVIPEEARKFILTYNHASKGTLEPKNDEPDADDDLKEVDDIKYNFAYETFQYPVVITTTQRLLLTLYANHKASAVKLASLAKSLMIIDEIQTIPRFMRQITMDLLDRLCQECDSRVVLASATVPSELKKIHTVGMGNKAKTEYLQQTSRYIDIGTIEASEVAKAVGMSPLVMFNTRKKAAGFYDEIAPTCNNVVYLSTGITRKERLERIKEIVSEKASMGSGKWPHKIVVSTQVLEAGVDASFGRIWRELAPLDSIVQVMGRLDRSAEMGGKAKIIIFGEYDSKNTMPYDGLDVKTTREVLEKLRSENHGKFTSVDLYGKLEAYYDYTKEHNKEVQAHKEKFEDYVKKQQYEKVWNMVAKTMASYNLPIIIPDNGEEWDKISSRLRSTTILKENARDEKIKNAKARKGIYAQYSEKVAEFPENKIHKIAHMLDEELLSDGIPFPKKECVGELYDKNGTGMDRHLLE